MRHNSMLPPPRPIWPDLENCNVPLVDLPGLDSPNRPLTVIPLLKRALTQGLVAHIIAPLRETSVTLNGTPPSA